MAKIYSNAVEITNRKTAPSILPRVVTAPPKDEAKKAADCARARRILVALHYPAKMWAQDMGVSVRNVQAWAAGEKEIPVSRANHILFRAREIAFEQLAAIEREHRDWIETKYGPLAR